MDETPGIERQMASHNFGHSIFSVFFIGSGPRLGEAVRVKEQAVARAEIERLRRILPAAEEAQRKARGLEPGHLSVLNHERRAMTGIADFDPARGVGFPTDQRGEVRRHHAVAENPAGALDQLVDRQAGCHQGAKDRVQVGHEHRGSDPFAGGVAQREEEISPVAVARAHDYVAIVATDRTHGLVVAADLPATVTHDLLRQQVSLQLRSQLQVLLERALLVGRQVVQAKPDEGVGNQPRFLHRLVADFADAVGAVVHAPERRINLVEKLNQARTSPGVGDGRLEPLTPIDQLLAKETVRRLGHRGPPRTEYSTAVLSGSPYDDCVTDSIRIWLWKSALPPHSMLGRFLRLDAVELGSG